MTSKHSNNKHHLTKTPVLTNQRLVLKEISLTDLPAIIEISVYDGLFATNEAEAIDIFKRIKADVANGDSIHWGIFLQDNHDLAGTCGYYRGYAKKRGEIGYVLKSAYRGRGIMSEAVKLMLAFGFETLQLNTVTAYTDPTNLASMAVLQRTGFTQVKSDNTDLKFEQGRP